jgi:dihydrofolate synthase/folylpolyglutamate synthase
VLGTTRAAIAAEKLAVVQTGATVILGEPEWAAVAFANGAAEVLVETGGNQVLGGVAASAFLGRPVEPAAVELPGRLERRGDEIWDGAHTPEAVRYIASRTPPIGSIVAAIMDDKDADGVLRELSRLARVLVTTSCTNPRALPAEELAVLGRAHFAHVEIEPDPTVAVARARERGSPILVTGSLYLLAELSAREEESAPCRTLVSG